MHCARSSPAVSAPKHHLGQLQHRVHWPCSVLSENKKVKILILMKKNPYSYWGSLQKLVWDSGVADWDASSLRRLPQSRWSRKVLIPAQLWPQPAPAARRARAKPKWMGAGACRKCHHSCSRAVRLVSRRPIPRKSTALSWALSLIRMRFFILFYFLLSEKPPWKCNGHSDLGDGHPLPVWFEWASLLPTCGRWGGGHCLLQHTYKTSRLAAA